MRQFLGPSSSSMSSAEVYRVCDKISLYLKEEVSGTVDIDAHGRLGLLMNGG